MQYKCNVANRITYWKVPIMNLTHQAKLYICHIITHLLQLPTCVAFINVSLTITLNIHVHMKICKPYT